MFRAILITILVIALGFCIAPMLTAHEEPTAATQEDSWAWPWQEDPQPTASLVHEFGIERDTHGQLHWNYQRR